MTIVETSATFPRSARLLTPSSFSAVFEKRSARRGRFFHLHVGPGKTAELNIGDAALSESVAGGGASHRALTDSVVCRLGIAVPKKLLKTAVHRNVVKRIAREVFRRIRPQLDQRDYVLRLSVKIDPKRQPLDRKALADDMRSLFFGRRSGNPVKFPKSENSSSPATVSGKTS